jgi:F-box domain
LTFVRDFIPELPAEIRIGIIAFLDLRDLITIRCVSKRWYESWTQVSICNKLMKEYFRSAFENTYMQLPDPEKRSAFISASDRLHAMQNGQYHSMTILNYDQDRHEKSTPAPVLDRRYCRGRVGWSIEGGIKVSDLCSGAMSTYMLPDRDKVQFWALSESVLVAGTADKCVNSHITLFSLGSIFLKLLTFSI